MELRNYSPFPPLVFQSRDANRQDFGVIVLRGTFDIDPGRICRPALQQQPILLVDEYLGEPGKSSLVWENNLAPYKPSADLHIRADAVSPNGLPATQWDVQARVGDVQSVFSVTGPRIWNKGIAGWRLAPPSPVSRVPVTYENAFGGTSSQGSIPQEWEANPIGVGWTPNTRNGIDVLNAPTIIPHKKYQFELGETLESVGLLPIPPQWSLRSKHAGTFNAAWEKTRWPDLPEDFEFNFYNSSPLPSPSTNFFTGSENFTFINLHRIPNLTGRLPGISLQGLVRRLEGQIIPTPINLDTVSFDLLNDKVYLCWRGIFPVDSPIRVFEVRIDAPSELIA